MHVLEEAHAPGEKSGKYGSSMQTSHTVKSQDLNPEPQRCDADMLTTRPILQPIFVLIDEIEVTV